MVQLAAVVRTAKFADVKLGAIFKNLIFGSIDQMTAAAASGDYYGVGEHAGDFILNVLSVPEGGGPAVFAKLKAVLATTGPAFPLLTSASKDVVEFGRDAANTPLQEIARLNKLIKYATYNKDIERVEGEASILINIKLTKVGTAVGEGGTKADSLQWKTIKPVDFTNGKMERGHLIGAQYGGRGIRSNIVPLYTDVNQKVMKSLETRLAQEGAAGRRAFLSVTPVYGGKNPSIPTRLDVVSRVDGKDFWSGPIYNVENSKQVLTLPP